MVYIRYNNYFLGDAKSVFNLAIVPPLTALFFEHELSYTPIPPNPSIKKTLDNGVKVYGKKLVIIMLA